MCIMSITYTRIFIRRSFFHSCGRFSILCNTRVLNILCMGNRKTGMNNDDLRTCARADVCVFFALIIVPNYIVGVLSISIYIIRFVSFGNCIVEGRKAR